MAQSKALRTSNRFDTKTLVMMALLAALCCVAAYISVPLPLPNAPHITLLNFVILLIALLLPPLESFLTILVWMLLGIVGLPVFIGGKSSFGYLLTPYGGYTSAYLVAALVMPIIAGRRHTRLRDTIAAVAGALIIDILGMFWLMYSNNLNLIVGFNTGVAPFIVLDLVKAVVAAQVAPLFRRAMR